MRLAVLTAFCGVLVTAPALADTVRVVRPGVACVSADALAALTLPDGSSRSAQPSAETRYISVASQGGCIPLALGVQMMTTAIKRQTDIVSFDPGDGLGARSFWIPKIDVEVVAEAGPVPVPGRVPGSGPIDLRPPTMERQAAAPPPPPMNRTVRQSISVRTPESLSSAGALLHALAQAAAIAGRRPGLPTTGVSWPR